MRYFYCDISNNNIKRTEADGNLGDILKEFYYLSETDGSFFGLENKDKQILQFAWEVKEVWLIDIPIKGTKNSLSKRSDYDECVNLIKYFYNGGEILSLKGFEYK